MRIVGVLISLCAGSAVAHDQWLEVQTAPSGVTGRIFLGDGKTIEEVPRKPERVARFELVTGDDVVATFAADAGAKPAGVAPPVPFLAAVYESKPATIELAPAKFVAYLKEEGLVAPAALSLAKRTKPVTEKYTRCLVAVPKASAPVGCEFELEVRTLDPLQVVARKAGAAASGQVVFLKERTGRVVAQASTGSDGIATFGKARGHRVTAILMTTGDETDVRSFWAATTLP